MGVQVPKEITEIARNLRKSMTRSERKLWKFLRYDKTIYRFLRQKPIYVYTEDSGLDRFIIPDFYCHEKRLILEIDGGIHDIKEIKSLDNVKEELVKKQGIRILRIRNEDIENDIHGVLSQIKIKLT